GGGRGGRGGRGQQTPMTAADFEKNFAGLDAAKVSSDLRVFWIACGTDDSLIGVNHEFTAWLKTKNVRHTTSDIPGFAHVLPRSPRCASRPPRRPRPGRRTAARAVAGARRRQDAAAAADADRNSRSFHLSISRPIGA